MSSHIPGNVSTYNEATAPLLERLKRKRSHMPFDYKTAFNELLDLSQNAKDDCIDAADELLNQQLPESYRMRTHIVLAACLEDLDEMEEHHTEALRIWTRLNTRYIAGENPKADVWLQQTRAQIDCLMDTIEEERALEEQFDLTSTPVKLSMSAVAAIETVPVVEDATSRVTSQPDQPDQPDLKNTSSDRSSFIPPDRPQTPVSSSISAIAAAESVPVLPSSDASTQAESSMSTIAAVEVLSSSDLTPTPTPKPIRLSMSTIAAVQFSSPDAATATSPDAASDAIEDEDNVDPSTDTITELTMSAISSVEFVPALRPTSASSDRSSSHDDSEPDSENTSWRTSTRRTRSSVASPARSASSNASSVQSAMTGSHLFGAIASPGHRRLPDHVGMSPASILKLAWDPNRTIRGRTVLKSSKTLPSRPSKKRASSTSESPPGSASGSASESTSESASERLPSTPSKRPSASPSKTLPSSPSKSPTPAHDTEQYFRSMLEPTSPTPARRDTEQYFKSMFEPPSPSTPVAGSRERNRGSDQRNLSPPKLKLPKGSGSFSDIRKRFSESE